MKKSPKQTHLRVSVTKKAFENFSWWLIHNVVQSKFKYIGLSIGVVSIGILLSLLGYCTAFQRSGSVLVALAVITVYLVYIAAEEFKNAQAIVKGLTAFERNKLLQDSLDPVGDSVMIKGAKITKVNAKEVLNNLPSIVKELYFYEATFGFFGTLIWGFGDLPFTCSQCVSK